MDIVVTGLGKTYINSRRERCKGPFEQILFLDTPVSL
jgi:hypothetical protein